MAVRLGLIGYGGWTQQAYVPALHRDGRARIVSAAAPSKGTRERIAEDLGPKVAVFAGVEELLGGSDVDAVMIAVPDAVHEQVLGAALEAGVAVYHDPPVADSRRRIPPMLTRLVAASQVTHADLEIGFMPVVCRAIGRVREGAVGQVQTIGIRLNCSWGVDDRSDLCTIGHLAPWYVDPMDRILGVHPKRVLVVDGRGQPGRAQGHTLAHFDYGEVRATFQANVTSVAELETTIEINGDDGDLVVDIFAGELRLRTRKIGDWATESVPALEPRAGWPGEHECVSSFLDAVTGGAPSTTNGEVVARLHRVGLAAEASKDSGTWAEVEADA